MGSPDLPDGRIVDVDGPVHYLEWEGSPKTTFFCVHGLGGSHASWLSVAPGLARHGRVLALDLPGFGRSPRAGRSSKLLAQRHVLSRFIRKQATGRVVIAGNSMGGTLALLEAAFEPDIVDGLVLTDPALPWAWRSGTPSPIVLGGFALYAIPGAGEWIVRQRLTRLSAERIVSLGFRVCSTDAGSIDPVVFRAHVELVEKRQLDPDAGPAFLEAARSLLSVVVRPRVGKRLLEGVRCPVLLLHGGRDLLVPVGFARAAARGRRSWRLRVFEDLGHIPQLEAPERWLAEIDRFAQLLAPVA